MHQKLLLFICAPYALFGSFLIRDSDTEKLTPKQKHEKTLGLKPSPPQTKEFDSKLYIGLTHSALVSSISTLLYGSDSALPFIPGITISKRGINTANGKTGYEKRFEIFPSTFFCTSFTYQKIYYRKPHPQSSSYYGLGFGLSTYQLIPLFGTLGIEWKSVTQNSSYLELRLCVLPIQDAKISYGMSF